MSKTRTDWIPQFPDGSGWDLDDKAAPYYYEHITKEELVEIKRNLREKKYRVTTVIEYVGIPPHRNTYYVTGDNLNEFLFSFSDLAESVIDVEEVSNVPNFNEKLKI